MNKQENEFDEDAMIKLWQNDPTMPQRIYAEKFFIFSIYTMFMGETLTTALHGRNPANPKNRINIMRVPGGWVIENTFVPYDVNTMPAWMATLNEAGFLDANVIAPREGWPNDFHVIDIWESADADNEDHVLSINTKNTTQIDLLIQLRAKVGAGTYYGKAFDVNDTFLENMIFEVLEEPAE